MERALNPTMTAGLDIRVVGDEVLVHDGGRNKVHVLNVTAGEILRLCDGEHTREDIVETVCTRFGADKDRVRLDVDRIIEEFRGLGIVG
jgi:PqqD family protein of HPr-rel-A system